MSFVSRILALAGALLLCGGASAQTSAYLPGVTTEGAVYFLPKTALRIAVRVEKTTYTPGDFYMYADRYLRMGTPGADASTTYRIISADIKSYGVADKSKAYSVKLNARTTTPDIVISEEGLLLAVNATPQQPTPLPAKFRQAKKPAKPDPHSYLSQEILVAGSTAKMAELIASEIYDIRESKYELNRGEADYMPSDGEQLRIMLNNLNEEEAALMSFFYGTEVKDTTETIVTFCPEKEISRMVLFRLSQRLGIVDNDDLGGAPVYVSVTDLKSVPSQEHLDEKTLKEYEKQMEGANGIFVNVPGKMHVTLSYGSEEMAGAELRAAQFGHVELLADDIFNKKFTTHLTLDPETGAVLNLEVEQPK